MCQLFQQRFPNTTSPSHHYAGRLEDASHPCTRDFRIRHLVVDIVLEHRETGLYIHVDTPDTMVYPSPLCTSLTCLGNSVEADQTEKKPNRAILV